MAVCCKRTEKFRQIACVIPKWMEEEFLMFHCFVPFHHDQVASPPTLRLFASADPQVQGAFSKTKLPFELFWKECPRVATKIYLETKIILPEACTTCCQLENFPCTTRCQTSGSLRLMAMASKRIIRGRRGLWQHLKK